MRTAKPEGPTIDVLLEDFVLDYRINKRRSLRRALSSLSHLRPFFEGRPAVSITTPLVKRYIARRLEEGAANATINRELAALKRSFSLAARQTPPLVDSVPFIPTLQEDNVRTGFFEHGEFLALREALPEYLRGFTTFAYKSGWRLEEIEGLTWDKVDLDLGLVRLEPGETKNRDARSVYLDSELAGIFRSLWMRRAGNSLPYVFLNARGNERLKSFRKTWLRACRAAGIPARHFHDLRRTAVRNMVRAGVPERVAMTLSGHRTRSVFERYNIVNEDDLRQASARQEAYLRRREARLKTRRESKREA